jgi:CBS domain-containing protein
MIATVKLPAVKDDVTIRDAIRRLQDAGASAVVVADKRGPVVVSDRSLFNTLISKGGDDDQPITLVTDRAFGSGLMGLLGLGSKSVLAEAQHKFIVTEVRGDIASVDADAKVAEEVSQPSTVDFPPPKAK